MQHDPDALVRLTQQQYSQLQLENEKFREALEYIASNDPSEMTVHEIKDRFFNLADHFCNKAKEALKGVE